MGAVGAGWRETHAAGMEPSSVRQWLGALPDRTWPAGEMPRVSGARGYARLVARSWYSTPMKKPQIRCHSSTAAGSFQPSGP